jgi:hypothetical protein
MLKKKFLIISLVLMTMLILVGSVSAVEWKAVNYASPEAIAESGLTPEEFNNLSKEDWDRLLTGKDKLNFAFSLQDAEGNDLTNSSNPNISINVNGLNSDQVVSFQDIETDSNIDQELVGEIYTFTNAGQTGRYGPSQTRINNTYQGTNLEGKVVSNNGIQEWTVPADGLYRITAYGAEGGISSGGTITGKGSIIKGNFNLLKKENIKILIGQKGETNTSTGGGGGGGGTFVTTLKNEPLLIVGGGAGAVYYDYLDTNLNALTTSTNNKSWGIGRDSAGGGGGGLKENGRDENGSRGNVHGISFINGGLGGTSTHNGGFGGGGGASANNYSGGGGGYIGGNEMGPSGGIHGVNAGGGRSFINLETTNIATSDGKYNNSTTFNSEPIENLNSYNTGHGKVTIEYLGK